MVQVTACGQTQQQRFVEELSIKSFTPQLYVTFPPAETGSVFLFVNVVCVTIGFMEVARVSGRPKWTQGMKRLQSGVTDGHKKLRIKLLFINSHMQIEICQIILWFFKWRTTSWKYFKVPLQLSTMYKSKYFLNNKIIFPLSAKAHCTWSTSIIYITHV